MLEIFFFIAEIFKIQLVSVFTRNVIKHSLQSTFRRSNYVQICILILIRSPVINQIFMIVRCEGGGR